MIEAHLKIERLLLPGKEGDSFSCGGIKKLNSLIPNKFFRPDYPGVSLHKLVAHRYHEF